LRDLWNQIEGFQDSTVARLLSEMFQYFAQSSYHPRDPRKKYFTLIATLVCDRSLTAALITLNRKCLSLIRVIIQRDSSSLGWHKKEEERYYK